MRPTFKPKLIALLISTGLTSAAMAEVVTSNQEVAPRLGFSAALELAKQHDPELKYAFYNYQAEQETDDISRANLLPQVSLTSTYRYSDVDDYYTKNPDSYLNNPDYVERTEKRQDDLTYQVNLQQSLVNIAAWQAYDSAKEAVRQSQFTYTRAEQELIYRLSQAYLETLLAAQQVYITQEKLESLQLKLDQTTRMNELGVGDRLNVLRARSSRDVVRSDLLQAQSKLDDAKTALENITGESFELPENWVQNSHTVLPNLVSGTQQEWLQKVMDNSQVLAEQASARSKALEAKSSQSQHLPTLDFSLGYTDRNSDDPFVESSRYIAAINLEVPIYSGGKTSAQARQAEASYNAAQVRYEKTLADKQQAVKLAYAQLSSYRDRLLALEESRKSSATFLEAAERQADLSLGSQVDVLEARSELYDVRLEFAKTLSDYLAADLSLLLETGQLNDQTLARYDQLFDQK